MQRATTPTHTFTLPTSGMSIDGNTVSIRLTQDETLMFSEKHTTLAQVRVLTLTNISMASQKFKLNIDGLLNEEILE